MPPFKKQHFLPAAYLKYFSTEPDRYRRDSFVWRVDEKGQRKVPVISQCFGDYFYSKTNAKFVETEFQDLEREYCHSVDRILAGNSLSGKQIGNLILSMFDFYLRNVHHINSTDEEGFAAYQRRVGIFLRDILIRKSEGEPDKRDAALHMQNNLGFALLNPPQTNGLFTSDNPSFLGARSGHDPHFQFCLMPLTPNHLAIACDKRTLELASDQISISDWGSINGGMVDGAVSCVFSSIKVSETNLKKIASSILTPKKNLSLITKNQWQTFLRYQSPENQFSFLRWKQRNQTHASFPLMDTKKAIKKTENSDWRGEN